MGQFWRRVVDVGRLLLESTSALYTTPTCTSSVVMRQEKKDRDICVGTRGVDDEGWGRMDKQMN